MPATFTRELLSREVRDRNGDVLGHVADLIIDTRTGSVTFVMVRIASNLDPSQLPWPSESGLISLPIDEVREISTAIHLHR
ncbi:MAG: PRC-barrel domain-containing protein [Candidatus Thalassarchaeaceae archaeon]|jgi:sporulation protein YlmC with PRC-barrel domain|nr:PRC-barrel domain-containing protein [Candidatus Thalassarchaeaceae archaeon]|tara:strand:- start:1557 stop:1799 length:243 start_codon:yes stop_codon:yes gene_type:complete